MDLDPYSGSGSVFRIWIRIQNMDPYSEYGFLLSTDDNYQYIFQTAPSSRKNDGNVYGTVLSKLPFFSH